MRCTFRACLLVLLLCIGFAAGASDVPFTPEERQWIAEHRTVSVAVDPSQWEQFDVDHFKGMNRTPLSGYVDLVSRHSGLQFRPVRTESLQASFDAIRSGDAALMLLTASPDAHLQGLVSSRAYYTGSTVFVTRQQAPLLLDLAQLEGRTLAYRRGAGYDDWLRLHRPGIKRLPAGDMAAVLAAVEGGIADAAIGLDTVIRPSVRRDYADTLRIDGEVKPLPVDVRLVTRSDQQRLLSIIDKAAASITEAEHATLLSGWLQSTYFGAPTPGAILRHYWLEALGVASGVALLLFLLIAARRARQAARRSERDKARFLAIMSHEVRNAANTISGSVELMLHGDLAPRERRLMETAHAAGERLRRMLNQALDYSRVDARQPLNPVEPSDIQALALACIAELRGEIDRKALTAEVSMPDGAIPWLMLDVTSTHQVLVNLLSNAVKFTHAGGIRVVLQMQTDAAGKVTLVIAVHDTGIGIPAEQQQLVFAPFSRINPRVAQPLGGAGLGLSICKGIVEGMGGTLGFTSKEGVGTTFTATLPCSIAPVPVAMSAPRAASPHAGAAASRTLPSVLVVEDHPGNLQLLLEQLHALGIEATGVADGLGAVEALGQARFDVVLLDCDLPDISGYEVARHARTLERSLALAPATLIAISANVEEEHLMRCQDSGIDQVFRKPLPLGDLRELLGLPPAARLDQVSTATDMERIFIQEIGRDLVAMEAAIRTRNLAVVTRHAHRICGAAMVMKESRLADTAMDVSSMQPDTPALWGEIERLAQAMHEQVAGFAARRSLNKAR